MGELAYVDVFDQTGWTNEERDYFALVDEAAADSKNMLIGNGNAKHATYLMDKFLQRAEREVRLFSGGLVRHTAENVSVLQVVVQVAHRNLLPACQPRHPRQTAGQRPPLPQRYSPCPRTRQRPRVEQFGERETA